MRVDWLDFPTVQFPSSLCRFISGSFQPMATGQILGVGNPFSTISRAVGNSAQQWLARLQLASMEEWRELEGFLTSLNGVETLFRMHDPFRPLPKGAAGGYAPRGGTALYFDDGAGGDLSFSDGTTFTTGTTTGLVASAAEQGDKSLHIKGLVADQETAFKVGDLFELNRNLYEVSRPARSDADGETRVLIRPALRFGAAVNDIVGFWKPQARFMLVSPEEGVVERSLGTVGSTGINAIEVPYYQ